MQVPAPWKSCSTLFLMSSIAQERRMCPKHKEDLSTLVTQLVTSYISFQDVVLISLGSSGLEGDSNFLASQPCFFQKNGARWIAEVLLAGHNPDLVTFGFIKKLMDSIFVAVDDQLVVLGFIWVQDGLFILLNQAIKNAKY